MGNCLVTKLKESVNNDNLDYLNYIKLSANIGADAPSEFNIFAVRNNESITDVQLLNTDGASIAWSGVYCLFTKGSSNKIELLFPRYSIDNVQFYDTKVEWDFNQVSNIFGLTQVEIGTYIPVPTNSVHFQNVTYFSLNFGANGDIANIASMPSIQYLNLSYNPYLTGDLSSIKDMPNLTEVVLQDTYVTDVENTVAYLQGRGVTVTYVPYPEM